ncbi:MAG TPA: glycine reductase, partial [Hyphomicrobiaceae bacterium]|nr:glycine reductase [Hyphomicrobiaceae bacterium]
MSEPSTERSVPYMERTRLYYRALGYTNDYVWAHFDDVPFTKLGKPLAAARVALVTTAGPPDRSNRDAKGRKQVWSGDIAAPPAGFDTDLAWDR